MPVLFVRHLLHAYFRGHWWSTLTPLSSPSSILHFFLAYQSPDNVFDVPLHDNLHNVSKRFDLRRILDNTLLKTRPNDVAAFVEKHE